MILTSRTYMLLLAAALALAFSSCTNRLYIEKSPDHAQQTRDIRKIVSIDPLYVFANTNKSIDKYYLRSDEKEQQLIAILRKNAALLKLDLEIVDKESIDSNNLNYFNYLVPLRDQVLLANDLNNLTLNRSKHQLNMFKGKLGSPDVYAFYNTPIIGSEYSFLSKVYGTPYFAMHGIFSIKRQKLVTYYYTVVINVESTEIIYREVRITRRKPNLTQLSGIIYDSLNILTKNKQSVIKND